jgi:hypothetical protein
MYLLWAYRLLCLSHGKLVEYMYVRQCASSLDSSAAPYPWCVFGDANKVMMLTSTPHDAVSRSHLPI